MPWFTVDDAFHSDDKTSKVLAAGVVGREAIGLWALAGSWCAQQLTDGFVPDYKVEQLGRFAAKHAKVLVGAGLWEPADGGYRFHNWLHRNPSRDHVMAKRAKTNARVERFRERQTSGVAPPARNGRRNGVTNDKRNGVTNAGETRLPDPRSQIPADQDLKRVADLKADHRVRAWDSKKSRRVLEREPDQIRDRAEVLLHVFERVVHDGARVADEDDCLSLLGGMLPALDDRAPDDPEALFERVLIAYAADKRSRGKTATVRWFAHDFAQWAQAEVERVAAPVVRADRIRELKAALEQARKRKRDAKTEDERASAGIAESEAERELVSLVGPEALESEAAS